MNASKLEDCIRRELPPEEQGVALAFIRFLADRRLTFYRDTGSCWQDKTYYWVMLGEECVCFIAVKNPDEPEHHWTVWSCDMASGLTDAQAVDPHTRETAWKYVGHCGRCGSCAGGRHRVIFGKTFADVCGCTFRIDNPPAEALGFLRKMVEIRISEIEGARISS